MTPDASRIANSATIAASAIIGKTFRPLLSGRPMSYRPTVIAENAFIGDFTIIGKGAQIGHSTIIDDYCKIEPNVTLGSRCLVQYRAYISAGTQVGDEVVIGGFITERTVIGSQSRIFGSIVHRHSSLPLIGWDDDEAREPSAEIGQRVFVGFTATVIGGISLGDDAYIAAGAIVSKDVPPRTLVRNVNEHHPLPSKDQRQ